MLGTNHRAVRHAVIAISTLALFGVAAARRHLFASDPQAQFALSLFKEAEQLTQLSRSRAARNGAER